MKAHPGKVWQVGLAAIFLLAIGSIGFAGENSTGREKFVTPALLEQLAQGRNSFEAIVLLKGYEETESVDFSLDCRLMESVQAQVARLQDAVLSKLAPDQYQTTFLFKNIPAFAATVTAEGLRSLISLDGVAAIQADEPVKAHTVQGIPLINPGEHRAAHGGSGLAVAIVDTGIDYTHPALGEGNFPNEKVIGGHDFGDNDSDPLDCNGHGTACAGIAAGWDTSVGDYIGGVAPQAKLYALKIVAGCEDTARDWRVFAAWDWCLTHQNDDPENPIKIISTSFGGQPYDEICDEDKPVAAAAARLAAANGISIFASSGNEGQCTSLASPACLSRTVSVGAVSDTELGAIGFCTGRSMCFTWETPECWTGEYSSPYACYNTITDADQPLCYTNMASFLDILAPSNETATPELSGGYYDSFGGTSAAAPYAAGAAAVIQSQHKALTGDFLSPAQVKNRLVNYGDCVTDSQKYYRLPRINIDRTINLSNVNNCTGSGVYAQPLTSGQPVTVELERFQTKHYRLYVPRGVDLSVTLTDLDADLDLYTGSGQMPDVHAASCQSEARGTEDESCYHSNNRAEEWYIMVWAWEEGRGVLTVDYGSDPTAERIANGVNKWLSLAEGATKYYFIDVPAERSSLGASLTATTGSISASLIPQRITAGPVGVSQDFPLPGRWYVKVSGGPGSGRLNVSYDASDYPEVTSLSNGSGEEVVIDFNSSPQYYKITVPEGATLLEVALTDVRGGSLFSSTTSYTRYGQIPTFFEDDCSHTLARVGADQVCFHPYPSAGDWYIKIKCTEMFSIGGGTLTATIE